MFTENEIATFLEIPDIGESVQKAKAEFKSKQAEYLDLSDHDFLSLIMMTPTVGIALANGNISLFEELALNKMARKMSKGGYFLKIDPVTHGMKFLIKSYETWEPLFLEVIKTSMYKVVKMEEIVDVDKVYVEETAHSLSHELMYLPYIFVRFLTSVFLSKEYDITVPRTILKSELEKIIDIGNKLGIGDLHFFHAFCNTFKVK